MKNRDYDVDDVEKVIKEQTEDEGYERYKRRQYRNLILKALLTFILGMLCSYLLKIV